MSNDHKKTKWTQLCQFITACVSDEDIPGLTVGLFNKGELESIGLGVTNVDHPLTVTEETLFQIGSVTKPFTGTAIMRLVEKGHLELDAPIQAYLPDFKVADRTASAQATVRHLLTHTSGWVGDFYQDTGAGDEALAKHITDMAILEQLASAGTVWTYSNGGFRILGRILEQITGQIFEMALKELVLDPLALQQIYFHAADVMTHRFAVGHRITKDGPQVARPWPLPRNAHPSGGIICHIKDLLQFADFWLGDGTTPEGARLLTPETMNMMHSPQVTIWNESEAMGLAWFIQDIDGIHLVYHTGGTNGQKALLVLVPEHQFAFAVLTNADQGESVAQAISRHALQLYLNLTIPEPIPIELPPEALAPYVGHYQRPLISIDLALVADRLVGIITYQGRFARDWPAPPPRPPMTLTLCDEDRLLVLDGPLQGSKMDIIRHADGSIGWLRFNNRVHIRENN